MARVIDATVPVKIHIVCANGISPFSSNTISMNAVDYHSYGIDTYICNSNWLILHKWTRQTTHDNYVCITMRAVHGISVNRPIFWVESEIASCAVKILPEAICIYHRST